MSKKRKSKYEKFVNHPRYGNKPRFTNDSFTLESILSSHWRYSEEEVIPGTCIEANLERQNFTISPRTLYVDLMRNCKKCRRKFIFYAKEQQYWYEELGFFIDCDCTKCTDCRNSEQEIKLLVKRYESLLKVERSKLEQAEFKNIAYELYQQGYIKDRSKLPS